MDKKEKQVLERELATGGYAVRELKFLQPQPKATYYAPTGKAIPNLPADPYSMRHYLRRGFSLMPPSTSKPQEMEDTKAKGKI